MTAVYYHFLEGKEDGLFQKLIDRFHTNIWRASGITDPRRSTKQLVYPHQQHGMRRAWLRGGENLHKRYLVHVAGYNLGLIMRLLAGAGTPRELVARGSGHLLVLMTADGAVLVVLIVITVGELGMLAASFEPELHG